MKHCAPKRLEESRPPYGIEAIVMCSTASWTTITTKAVRAAAVG